MADDFRGRVFHPEDVDRLRDERRAALARGVPFDNEQRVRRKNGQYRWLLIQYNPLLDEQGEVIRWYATGTDIDDRKRAEERTRKENLALREEIDHSSMFEEIVGSSEAIRGVLSQVTKVAKTDSTVLILGETGTGKELIARAVHRRSGHSERACVAVNCAAIPQSLITSELFGHEKGAFTAGDEAGLLCSGFALINANSIHHSYNKCVTIHSTQNVTIHDNVCARIVGHIFYEEVGDEANITFKHNLGLGAMSNSFDINNGTDMSRDALITQYWWPGDNLANLPNLTYDGFLIKDTDNQHNGTAGQCFKFEPNKTININGSFVPDDNGKQGSAPPCRAGAFYLEPPSGFWIINPSAILVGNSICGCQGEGKGYWYVPPGRGPLSDIKFIPVDSYTTLTGIHGHFTDNRVHGCDSGLYSGDQQDITADALQPYLNGVKNKSHPVMAEFDGLTATRNRFRGAWLRPNFYTLKDARFATNRDDISLVTSGGPDGNYPGTYSLLTNSVTVGVSQNNVDRWGPCPKLILGGDDATHVAGQVRGFTRGCIRPNFRAEGPERHGRRPDWQRLSEQWLELRRLYDLRWAGANIPRSVRELQKRSDQPVDLQRRALSEDRHDALTNFSTSKWHI
jgi:hypothetical protein